MKTYEKRQHKIKNTIGMFDLLKGVVMLLVMLAHTYGIYDHMVLHGTEYDCLILVMIGLIRIFAEAMMPVLFILSGYGFRKTTFVKCIKKQACLLLVPYAVTGVLASVLTTVAFYLRYNHFRGAVKQGAKLAIGFMLGLPKSIDVFGVNLVWCGPAWFLVAMFVSMVVFNLLLNKYSGRKLFIASCIVACLGWGLSFIKVLPWCISQGLIAALYVCMGYFAKKEKIFTERLSGDFKTIAYIAGTILLSLFLCQFGAINMADSEYAFGPLSIALNGLLSIAFIYIFLLLNRFNGKISAWIRTLGRYSLYILCIHTIEYKSFGGILQMDFVEKFKDAVLFRSVIIFVTRVAVVYLLTMGYAWLKNQYMNKVQREEQK